MGVPAMDSLDPSVLAAQSTRASVIIADVDLRVLHVEGPPFDRLGSLAQDGLGRSLSEVLPAGPQVPPRARCANRLFVWLTSSFRHTLHRCQVEPAVCLVV